MFIATSDIPAEVAFAAVADGAPPGGATMSPSLTATRTTFTGEPTATCYDAVMLWLFKSGLVSFRWLLKNRNANTRETLTAAFGPGLPIWEGDFGPGDSLPNVPAGHIVHIYEHEQSWRGHWMVSTVNGGACGCNNNDEDPPVPRGYCSSLSLNKQFLDFGTGYAFVINPVQIPERE